MFCDFASLSQVRALAAGVMSSHPKLHILVNNAGSASPKREVTEDGIERTFAVNHLAPFLLTNLLLDLLKRSAPAKVINVASIEHRQGTLPFDNLQFEKGGYRITRAYARSKLANVLFTTELARRLARAGVRSACAPRGKALHAQRGKGGRHHRVPRRKPGGRGADRRLLRAEPEGHSVAACPGSRDFEEALGPKRCPCRPSTIRDNVGGRSYVETNVAGSHRPWRALRAGE